MRKPGNVIKSLDDLYNQEFIYFRNKLYHRGFFGSWQIRFAYIQIKAGNIRYAVDYLVIDEFIGDIYGKETSQE